MTRSASGDLRSALSPRRLAAHHALAVGGDNVGRIDERDVAAGTAARHVSPPAVAAQGVSRVEAVVAGTARQRRDAAQVGQVVARAAVEAVAGRRFAALPGTAVEVRPAVLCVQRVGARAAEQPVGAEAAQEAVVAVTAVAEMHPAEPGFWVRPPSAARSNTVTAPETDDAT
jgi:hypothetical protein